MGREYKAKYVVLEVAVWKALIEYTFGWMQFLQMLRQIWNFSPFYPQQAT